MKATAPDKMKQSRATPAILRTDVLSSQYTSVISKIQEFIQKTSSKVRALRFQRREEELVQSVLEAMQLLQSAERRVSISAIARLVHLSPAALYRYSKVKLILEDIARQRWCRKEDC